MFKKLIRLIPNDTLVHLYKRMPFKRLKDWVVYRTQYKFLVAVLGIITNEEGKVVLLKHSYRKEPWGIPGGWMERENPVSALQREVREETGLSVRIDGPAHIIYDSQPHRVELVFRGQITGGTFRPSSEITDICYCEPGNWPEGLPEEHQKLIELVLRK